jgi:hypothetical protein
MNISDEAVEAAAKILFWQDDKPETMAECKKAARQLLAAAAPILLSHERQQTADAHRDAIVNRDTADRLERELEAAKADAWDEALTEAAGLYMDRSSADYMKETNPYRSQA